MQLSRRTFLAGAGCAAAGVGAPPAQANVLFIMTDQHRFDALSCAGNRIVGTPNLDRLASQGTRFTGATCSSPLCGPSRASMLSGQYLHGHHCAGNFELKHPGMPESVETWEEILAGRGYHAEYHGKWHVGSANTACYAGGLQDYLELYHDYLSAKYPGRQKGEGEAVDRYTHWPYRYIPVDRMMLRATREGYEMPHHNEAGENTVTREDSLTAWTVGRAIDFLRRKPKQPFSLTCSILHPHAPLVASRPYFDIYDPAKMPMPEFTPDVFTPPEKAAIPKILTPTPDGLGSYMSLYYGLIKEVDDWVGKLLQALDQSGCADNTLVVFTSDHGEMLGEHARISKMVFYEASIRVPMILRFPGRIPAGGKVAAPASGADLAPTILDYLGIPVPSAMHGRSLRAAIDGKRPAFDHAYVELGREPERPEAQRILRSQHWKLAFKGGQPFLYDLAADPGENRNLLSKEHRNSKWVAEGKALQGKLVERLEAARSPELDKLRSFPI